MVSTESPSVPDRFSSRWGLLAASLGMAIGAGNIWRFPRVVAQHGGGAFILAWLVALFVWSIPLLIVEFWWGRKTRKGPIAAFQSLLGKKWAWMGGFVALCCVAIMLYYAVVCGWCVFYFVRAVSGGLQAGSIQAEWDALVGSRWAVLSSGIALAGAVAVVLFGVRSGIERISKLLVPSLFVLLTVAAVRALSLPGASAGLERLFAPDFDRLLQVQTWLEAFSQSAWSTGAGWGLMLVYAGYTRAREEVVLNACITGLGNNAASLLAAFAILPTVYALLPAGQAMEVAASGNEGLAFVWMPRLFLSGRLPAGGFLLAVFFCALLMAAISSLIAMVELAVKTLEDLGLTRRRAAWLVLFAGIGLGFPSASSMEVFKNQDWVWGLGLLISGAFFTLGASIYGVRRLRLEIQATSPEPWLGRWFDWVLRAGIPFAFLAMIIWWFYRSITWDPDHWWNPLAVASLGTCLLQWGLALGVVFLVLWLVRSRPAARKA